MVGVCPSDVARVFHCGESGYTGLWAHTSGRFSSIRGEVDQLAHCALDELLAEPTSRIARESLGARVMTDESLARVNSRRARVQRFQVAYDRTCQRLGDLGIPFWKDPQCEVFYDDDAFGTSARPAMSYHWGGKIVICRDHVLRSLHDAQLTLVHELTHYWCERFPRAMRRAHAFRVPRPLVGDCPESLLQQVRDPHHADYLGPYSQVNSEECLAEFMAQQVVVSPDLRQVPSRAARSRFHACRRMLRRLKAAYSRSVETTSCHS